MTAESRAEARRRVRVIVARLQKAYPQATTALDHKSAIELLIATILSAQCTDERVNKVTPVLFTRYPKAADYAAADQAELEALIRSTGFYRNKAKSIRGVGQKLVEDFGGDVPDTMEELLTLPGVARKTANVLLGNFFGKAEGIVVDTHVFRLSHRLALSQSKTAVQVEQDLIDLVARKDWIDIGNMLILHGRSICSARQPKCTECSIESHCPKIGVPPPKDRQKTQKPVRPLRDRIRASKRKR